MTIGSRCNYAIVPIYEVILIQYFVEKTNSANIWGDFNSIFCRKDKILNFIKESLIIFI